MAVPKSRTSKARRDKRRSSHWKLDMPTLVACPECHQFKLAHRVCKHCGFYDGRKVIDVEGKSKKEA